MSDLDALRKQVEDLAARVRRLEVGAPEKPAPPTEEREDLFGPAVQRADPSGHRRAVGRALAMLGMVPAPASETRGTGHRRAIEQARRMSGGGAPAEEVIPLPEIAERPAVRREAPTPQPVDLGGALDVDLEHAAQAARASALYLLFPQVLLMAALMALLPGPRGVLAALPGIALLAAPLWGARTATLRAHARFFTILVLARCLAPDILLLSSERPWANARVLAMGAAMIPGLVLVWRRSLGWGLVAFLLSLVAGGAVAVEADSVDRGLVVAAVMLMLSLVLRRAA